jgi:hypothetical protein
MIRIVSAPGIDKPERENLKAMFVRTMKEPDFTLVTNYEFDTVDIPQVEGFAFSLIDAPLEDLNKFHEDLDAVRESDADWDIIVVGQMLTVHPLNEEEEE